MESNSPFSSGDADSASSSTGLSSLCVCLSWLSTRFACNVFFCLFVSRGGRVWVGHRKGAGAGVGAGRREGARGEGWGGGRGAREPLEQRGRGPQEPQE